MKINRLTGILAIDEANMLILHYLYGWMPMRLYYAGKKPTPPEGDNGH